MPWTNSHPVRDLDGWTPTWISLVSVSVPDGVTSACHRKDWRTRRVSIAAMSDALNAASTT